MDNKRLLELAGIQLNEDRGDLDDALNALVNVIAEGFENADVPADQLKTAIEEEVMQVKYDLEERLHKRYNIS